jgi:hypothetical protein
VILAFILAVSVGLICLWLGIDIACQIWVEKREERKARRDKIQEAETILYASFAKRFEENAQTSAAVIELNVVTLPKKPVSGRHRLSAA